MPSATPQEQVIPAGKKRRRGDDIAFDALPPFSSSYQSHRDDAILSTVNHGNHPSHLQARKLMPMPAMKKMRVVSEEDERLRPRSTSPALLRQTKSPSVVASGPGREELQETDANSRPAPATRSNSASLLSRCHICHRKPTKKSDLDSFADCQGCGQRTCFVCIRQCLDWRPNLQDQMSWTPPTQDPSSSFHMDDADPQSEDAGYEWFGSKLRQNHENERHHHKADSWAKGGHRQMVCSRCCVEKGSDGDVVCLGCLPFVEG